MYILKFHSDTMICMKQIFVQEYFAHKCIIWIFFLPLCIIIGNLDFFPFISTSDIVSLNELTVILKNIDQRDVKVSSNTIISITAHTIRLTEKLLMSVSTVKFFVILYVLKYICKNSKLLYNLKVKRRGVHNARMHTIHNHLW